MINVAFCDDDLATLNELHALFHRYHLESSQDISCRAFQSPLELLAVMEKGVHFDVVFLDIIMPGENGISTAREIRQYDDAAKIIFLTSSSEFAVQSYTVGAYFYQLKPIQAESLFRLMDSVIEDCKKSRQCSLILQRKSGVSRIDLEKLEYCEVIGHKLLFHLENGGVIEGNGSMDELCATLASYDNFLRPHRSFLVNMEYISNISYKIITMSSRAEIPVPHGKCAEIKDLYLEYAFSRKQVILS